MMKHRNEYYEMTGREIITSFKKLHNTYLFEKIQNLKKPLDKKFHRISTDVNECYEPDLDDISVTDLRSKLRELRDKRLPYKLYTKIVWFVPNEEVEQGLKQR